MPTSHSPAFRAGASPGHWLCLHPLSVFTMSPPCPLPSFRGTAQITNSTGQTGVYQPCYCLAPVQPGLFGGNKSQPFSSSHWIFGPRLP